MTRDGNHPSHWDRYIPSRRGTIQIHLPFLHSETVSLSRILYRNLSIFSERWSHENETGNRANKRYAVTHSNTDKAIARWNFSTISFNSKIILIWLDISPMNIYVFLKWIVSFYEQRTSAMVTRSSRLSRDLDWTNVLISDTLSMYLEYLYDLIVCYDGNENTRIRVRSNE